MTPENSILSCVSESRWVMEVEVISEEGYVHSSKGLKLFSKCWKLKEGTPRWVYEERSCLVKLKLWPFAAGSLYMWGQLGLVSPLISAVSRSKTRSLSWCGLLVFWREACSCMIMLWFCVVIIILRDIAHMIHPLYITVFESFKKSNKGHIWAISLKILCVMPVFNMPCSWF